MARTYGVADTATAYVDLKHSVASSLQHIAKMQERIDRLLELRDDALAQLGHRAGFAYSTDVITLDQYAELYSYTRDVVRCADPRIHTGWSLHWPESKKAMARFQARFSAMFAQNEEWGWSGEMPLDLAARPPGGQSVVYVLYQDAEPVYVGSTFKFSNRMRGHRDKQFNRWTAYPCNTREEAYQMEERLLNEHMPNLNRRRGR